MVQVGVAVAHPAGCTALVPRAGFDRLAALVLGMAAEPGATTTAGRAPSGGPSRGGSTRWDDPEASRIEALVELAQKGDAQAFGQLYERYVDTVYRYVYVRVGSHQLAEDITGETFLRALRRLDTFSWQGRDIVAWFVTIARNLITDHRKSSRFRLEITTGELVGLDDGRRSSPTGGDAPPNPEAAALLKARDTRLVEAIRTLKPEQQECIVLRFFQELSLAETALAMSRSEGAIKQLQLRAVRALAAAIGREQS